LIIIFIYDLYFLIITNKNIFGIVGIQTDNIIILVDKRFLVQEKKELRQAKYTTKPKEKLIAVNLLLYSFISRRPNNPLLGLRQKTIISRQRNI
jgi:hypothetical protein